MLLRTPACNIGEAEAIARHLIRGESVAWCDQGHAWAQQDRVTWFYLAALLLVAALLLQSLFGIVIGTSSSILSLCRFCPSRRKAAAPVAGPAPQRNSPITAE